VTSFNPLLPILSILIVIALIYQYPAKTISKEKQLTTSLELVNFAKHKIAHTIRKTYVPESFIKIYVSTEEALQQGLSEANLSEGNTAIYLSDGHYKLTKTLVISKPNILLLSKSGDPQKVLLSGSGMQAYKKVFHVVLVASHGTIIDGMTLQNTSHHLVQIQGGKGANDFVLRNCVLQDSYQQLIKVTASASMKADNGLIENCIFQYTRGIGPNWYIGGIDAHGATNWIVQNNLFMNIASPGKRISEHAVHFWDKSESNIVRHNYFVENDRAIGFGMRLKTRANRIRDNIGGSIYNNLIYHSSQRIGFADVGIVVENSPDTEIKNNFIYQLHKYPNAIEFRFDDTDNVFIENNITNRDITGRNGAKATMHNNEKLSLSLMQQRMREMLTGI
jgi:hypothetical protein